MCSARLDYDGAVSFDCFENFFPMQTTDADNDGAEAPYIKEHKIIVDGEAKEELVKLRTGIYAGQEVIKTWETPSPAKALRSGATVSVSVRQGI